MELTGTVIVILVSGINLVFMICGIIIGSFATRKYYKLLLDTLNVQTAALHTPTGEEVSFSDLYPEFTKKNYEKFKDKNGLYTIFDRKVRNKSAVFRKGFKDYGDEKASVPEEE